MDTRWISAQNKYICQAFKFRDHAKIEEVPKIHTDLTRIFFKVLLTQPLNLIAMAPSR